MWLLLSIFVPVRRERRYVGTPRNIFRHVIMSDFDQVAATLPAVSALERIITAPPPLPPNLFLSPLSHFSPFSLSMQHLSNSPILMYDPLPPLDSTSGYSRPERYPTFFSLSHTLYIIYHYFMYSLSSLCSRQPRVNQLDEDENPFLLFIRSLLPTFDQPVYYSVNRELVIIILYMYMFIAGKGTDAGRWRPSQPGRAAAASSIGGSQRST